VSKFSLPLQSPNAHIHRSLPLQHRIYQVLAIDTHSLLLRGWFFLISVRLWLFSNKKT